MPAVPGARGSVCSSSPCLPLEGSLLAWSTPECANPQAVWTRKFQQLGWQQGGRLSVPARLRVGGVTETKVWLQSLGKSILLEEAPESWSLQGFVVNFWHYCATSSERPKTPTPGGLWNGVSLNKKAMLESGLGCQAAGAGSTQRAGRLQRPQSSWRILLLAMELQCLQDCKWDSKDRGLAWFHGT